jgi:hypothetical protein
MSHTAMIAVDAKDQKIWRMTLDFIKDDLARSTVVYKCVDLNSSPAKLGGKGLKTFFGGNPRKGWVWSSPSPLLRRPMAVQSHAAIPRWL